MMMNQTPVYLTLGHSAMKHHFNLPFYSIVSPSILPDKSCSYPDWFMLMNLERLTDLREPSFSSPDFQVGVRNDTDGGELGGNLSS